MSQKQLPEQAVTAFTVAVLWVGTNEAWALPANTASQFTALLETAFKDTWWHIETETAK